MPVLHPVDAAMARLAETQSSVFSVRQVIAAGGNYMLIRRRLAAGTWVQHAHSVLGYPGTRDTFRRRLSVALLDAGPEAMASHESAAHLHGLQAFPERLAILVPHGHHHRNVAARVHQTRRLPVAVAVEGVPTTPVARTLCDLAASYGRRRIGRAVDDAHLRRLCSVTEVQRTFLALAASGRPGVEVMRAVLSERVDGYVPTRSALEQALDSVLATIGGIEFTREFALPSRAGDPHIVDRFLPQARLVVEADGRLWHGRLDAMERDRQRDRRAAALGLRTLRYGWRELVHEPDDVAAELSAIISAERIPHAG